MPVVTGKLITDASELNLACQEINDGLLGLTKPPDHIIELVLDVKESLRLRRFEDLFVARLEAATDADDVIIRFRVVGKLEKLRAALRAGD